MATTPIKPHWIPREEDSDSAKKEFMDAVIDDRNMFRRWHMLRKSRNIWFYRGRHWIAERRDLRADSSGLYRFDEIRPHGWAPNRVLPVDNIIGSTVDNEVSRLGRREFVGEVTAASNTPELIAAARLAKQVSASNLKTANWAELRERIGFDLVLGGDATYKTWWDETMEDMIRLGSPDAMQCSACGEVVSSPQIPLAWQDRAMHSDMGSVGRGEDGPTLTLAVCPTCSEPTPMEPYDVSPEEAAEGVDVFNRPLGVDRPKGKGCHEVVSPFDAFPEGGGATGEPSDIRIMGQRTVRSLDWVRTRIPEWADKIEAEDPGMLMKAHPTLGEHGFLSTLTTAKSVYPEHAFFQEVHVNPMPIPGLELGLSFVRVGEHIMTRPLCVEMEGADGQKRKVKRVQYQTARFKRIPGEFWGRTVVDDLVPLNRKLNYLDYQVECIRDGGIPQLWVPTDVEMYARQSDEGGAWRMMEFEGGPQGWSPKEAVLNMQPIAGNAYMPEREAILADMQKVGGAQDIELGQSPGGSAEMNTSYLMILNEEAAQKRGSRERSLINCYESGWEHDIALTWTFRKEEQSYEVVSKADAFEHRSFRGADILGQCAVKIQKGAGYDNSIFQKTAAQETRAAFPQLFNSPAAIDRFLDLTGMPKDLNEDTSIQVKRAESTFSEFMRNRALPVVDETTHDPWVRYQVYGKRWEGDECVEARAKVRFDETVLPVIQGWQEEMARIDQEEAIARPIYGKVPPEQWEQVYEQGKMLAAQAAKFSGPPPVPGMPPPPPAPAPQFPRPPINGFLPRAVDQRIYMVWRTMLPEIQDPPVDPGAVPLAKYEGKAELVALLRMRAIIEAYKKLAEAKKAMAGQVAAPGGASTPSGMEPTPGAPVMAAPGAGPVPGGGV